MHETVNVSTYVALIDVNESQVQNAQDLVAIWGDIRTDVEDVGGELLDAYAVLGEHDFIALFEADDEKHAMQISIGVERYGLDTQTMEIVPVEELGDIVEDF